MLLPLRPSHLEVSTVIDTIGGKCYLPRTASQHSHHMFLHFSLYDIPPDSPHLPGLTGHIRWADRCGTVTDTLLIVLLHFPAVRLRYLCNFCSDRKTDLYSLLLYIQNLFREKNWIINNNSHGRGNPTPPEGTWEK